MSDSFTLYLFSAFGLLLVSGCKHQVTPDDVRRTEPSFKVWKEETFYNDTGGIKYRQCHSKDSTYWWSKTCFPSDSGCFTWEHRDRTDLYWEANMDNGWTYIDYLINDGTGKPPAYKVLSFYPSGQLESEGIEANVMGHPASNCSDSSSFSINTDSLLSYNQDGGGWCYFKVKTGSWKYYHENGSLRLTEEYDTVYGQCTKIYQDSISLATSFIVLYQPILNGSVKQYNENGSLEMEQIWKKGRFIEEITYD